MKKLYDKRYAVKIALISLLTGVLWIFISDYILKHFISTTSDLTFFQNIKGTVFVIIVSATIYFIMKRDSAALRSFYNELSNNEKKYKAIVEDQTEFICRWLPNGTVTYINEAYAKYLGKSQEELMGKVLDSIILEEDRQLIIDYFKDFSEKKDVRQIEHKVKLADGSIRWHQWTDRAIFDTGNKFIEFQSVGRDISKKKEIELTLKKNEEQLVKSLKEKEVMIKEIHHRVKNNLQIILSLLRLQSEYVNDTRALEFFKISEDRIQTMSLIHEMLYSSVDLSDIDFEDYIKRLSKYLLRSSNVKDKSIIIETNTSGLRLTIDNAIPCGLIINELISNSLKHAFKGKPEGKIEINASVDNEGIYSISIKDNGIGFSDEINFRNTSSLGMQLVISLTEQIHGTIEQFNNNGCEYLIKFPVQNTNN